MRQRSSPRSWLRGWLSTGRRGPLCRSRQWRPLQRAATIPSSSVMASDWSPSTLTTGQVDMSTNRVLIFLHPWYCLTLHLTFFLQLTYIANHPVNVAPHNVNPVLCSGIFSICTLSWMARTHTWPGSRPGSLTLWHSPRRQGRRWAYTKFACLHINWEYLTHAQLSFVSNGCQWQSMLNYVSFNTEEYFMPQ